MATTLTQDHDDCALNICGHVESVVTDDHDHGEMTPHDIEALLDALQHSLGFRSGPSNCYVCHIEHEEREEAARQRLAIHLARRSR